MSEPKCALATSGTRFAPCILAPGHEGLCEAKPRQKWKRANYVPAPHYFALNQACVAVNRALDGFGCYLVGSALERRDYRDVDVRYIMSDDAFDRLFRVRPGDADSGAAGWLNPLWSLMCLSISVWMSQATGLPIDFQIQRQTQANEKHDGVRSALGIFHDYPGERPSDVVPVELPGNGTEFSGKNRT